VGSGAHKSYKISETVQDRIRYYGLLGSHIRVSIGTNINDLG